LSLGAKQENERLEPWWEENNEANFDEHAGWDFVPLRLWRNPTRRSSHVDDLNLDKVPEIIYLHAHNNTHSSIYAFEWNGQTFQNLSPNAHTNYDDVTIKANSQSGLKDFAGKGTINLSGYYGYPYFGTADFNIPQLRALNYIYSWNGKNFVFTSEEFEPPQYRFQAIQDGDFKALLRQYDDALLLYQNAIFSKKLDW